MPMDLPTGGRGKATAIGLTVAVLALLVYGAVLPLLDWHHDLTETRAQKTMLAARMATLADSLPALQRQFDAGAGGAPAGGAPLAGATDAVAAAALQDELQDMARKAGVTLASTESIPAELVGRSRRIGLRLAVEGRWTLLVGFLQAIAQLRPRILIDDLQIQRGAILVGADSALNASFIVFGFRSADK